MKKEQKGISDIPLNEEQIQKLALALSVETAIYTQTSRGRQLFCEALVNRLCHEYDILVSNEFDVKQLTTHFSITYKEIDSVLQRFKIYSEDKNVKLTMDKFKSTLVAFLGEKELIRRKLEKHPSLSEDCPYEIPGGCGSIYIDDPGIVNELIDPVR